MLKCNISNGFSACAAIVFGNFKGMDAKGNVKISKYSFRGLFNAEFGANFV